MKNNNTAVLFNTSASRCGRVRPLTQKARKTARGFTLIELLVVVIIIAILAAIALPQYQKTVLKSRVTELISTVRSLQKATELYVLENGYPSNSTILWNRSTNLLGIDIPYPDAMLISDIYVTCNKAACQISIWGDSSKQGDGEIAIFRGISANTWNVEGGGDGNFGNIILPTLKQTVAAE